MKHLPQSIALLVCVVAGSIYVYLAYIDGVYVNKPLTFLRGVDPEHLLLEKDIYRKGETPRLLSAFCKNREFDSTIQWRLLNGEQITYSERKSKTSDLPVGCYPENGFIKYTVEKIPDQHDETCDSYFDGVSKLDLGNGRIREQHYKTQKFCITN